MGLLWDRGTLVCSKSRGHLTKMAAMPIYGKNPKKIFFFGTNGLMTLKHGMHHEVLEYYQVCSNDDPELTLTYLRQGQIWSLMLLYGEKGKKMDCSEAVVVYDLKLATDDRSDKKFLLTSKLCPLWDVCPLPRGYIHVSNRDTNCIKDFFETCNKWIK